MLFYHFRMAENPAQNVVEVMSHTAGECTYRLHHAAGLLQARFQPCPFLFHRMPPDGRDNGIERHAQQTEFACREVAAPVDRIETQRDSVAVLMDMSDAPPSPQAGGNANILVFAGRHPTDAGNVDNSIDGLAELRRKRRRILWPARRKALSRPAPEVRPRRCTRQHKISPVAA